jgi:hypothetical protein
MTDYKEVGKKIINGKKRVIYKKSGSKKEYLKYKDRMMNIVKYKKMIEKKMVKAQTKAKKSKLPKAKKSKTKKSKYGKKRGGNNDLSESFNTAMKQISLISSTSTTATPTTSASTKS